MTRAAFSFRPFQKPVFMDRETGVLILHWSRQIGKSEVLARWAVDRLLTRPGRLVTVLSNSRDNGAEFVAKAAAVCNALGVVFESLDESPDITFENMRMEVRITVKGKVGRIKVLAANPRTARGFSGDLILDEFAFHENSNAIWEAAEPILSSNPDFLCRIASTGNGKHNMFFRMVNGGVQTDDGWFISAAGFRVSRVARTDAHRMGVKVYDPVTRQPITPAQARAKALDKRAYDQNYECAFNDENQCLLTHELIQAAMRGGPALDEQEWSPATLARLRAAKGDLFFGLDVGRNRDISFLPVLERDGQTLRVIAGLRMSGMRLPAQQVQLDCLMRATRMRGGCVDMTGIGLGLTEYAQEKWGDYRVQGVNFGTSEPISDRLLAEGRKHPTAKVTEIMATELLGVFEERRIEFHVELDADAIDDLRKPEKITTPGGRVSIAAVRDEAGHADHFWGLALAVRRALKGGGPVDFARQTTSQPPIGNLGFRPARRAEHFLVA